MDVFDGLEPLHQPAELRQAADFHRGRDHRGLVVVDLHFGPGKVDLALGDDRRDVTQQPGAVPSFDLDSDRVELPAAGVPIDLYDAFLVGDVQDVLAACAMDRDPLAAGDIAADWIARHRIAALRDLREHAPLTLDANLTGGLELWNQRDERKLTIPILLLAGRHVLEQHRVWADVPVSDGGVEIIQLRESELAGELQDPLVPAAGPAPVVHPPEFLVGALLPFADVFLAPLLLEPAPDLLRSARRLDEAQPVAAGSVRSLRGEDLADVAVLQLVVQRPHPPVGLGADAAMADLGVDPVRKIHGRRARRQR